MKINLAKSAGFCFGVKRAIDIAFKTIESGAKVYMLGDIVHNEDVIKRITQAGIKKIKKLSPDKNKALLLRAHGTGADIIKKASKLGYTIVDATCPMVKEIHKIAKTMEEKGYKIIIIGDKKHDEVHGIMGQLKTKVIIIDDIKNIPLRQIKQINRAAIVAQSTQNTEKVIKIVKALRPYISDLKFFNTICRPTRIKQEEIKKMPNANDIMIVIGSKTSANTKRLYEIAKSLNRRTFWIQAKKEIRPEWFRQVKNIGVTAGASTPDSTIVDIVNYIRQVEPFGLKP